MNRLAWLDMVKGICILFVIIGHVFAGDNFILRICYALGVPVFFLVTGYLDQKRRAWNQDALSWLKKRTRQLLLPYFGYSALVMLWQVFRLLVFGYGSTGELLHCLMDIFCFEGISSLWFIAVLYFSEILFFFTMKLTQNRSKHGSVTAAPWLFALYLTTALFLSFLVIRYDPETAVSFRILVKCSRIAARILLASCFLYLGSLTEDVLHLLSRHRLLVVIGCILTVCSIYYNGPCDFHYLNFGRTPLYLLNAMAGFLCLSCLFMKLETGIFSLPLSWLGRNSLFLMATHLIFLDLVNILALLCSLGTPYDFTSMLWGKLLLVGLFETGAFWVKKRVSSHL